MASGSALGSEAIHISFINICMTQEHAHEIVNK